MWEEGPAPFLFREVLRRIFQGCRGCRRAAVGLEPLPAAAGVGHAGVLQSPGRSLAAPGNRTLGAAPEGGFLSVLQHAFHGGRGRRRAALGLGALPAAAGAVDAQLLSNPGGGLAAARGRPVAEADEGGLRGVPRLLGTC
ncbi:unnamed protein product [Symbiodinium sp. KB8]|nr:unnamed protein product [Symbiodinium sp. KB8]